MSVFNEKKLIPIKELEAITTSFRAMYAMHNHGISNHEIIYAYVLSINQAIVLLKGIDRLFEHTKVDQAEVDRTYQLIHKIVDLCEEHISETLELNQGRNSNGIPRH